jgi:mRNA interferase HigB
LGALDEYRELRYSYLMRVISRRAIREFSEKHPNATVPLGSWYKAIRTRDYANFTEPRQSFNSIDAVAVKRRTFYVFNVGGNNFRLIATIHFDKQRLYVRFILTHADYDRGDWKK